MEKYIKPVLIGGTIGAILMALISAASTMSGAAANDQPVQRIMAAANNVLFPVPTTSELFKLGDDEFLVSTTADVSLTPTATSTVRKIGYGRSRYVTISTTSSGVYSSDGLASPNFRYPGIDVKQIPHGFETQAADTAEAIAAWTPRHGWVPAAMVSAGSFMVITRDGAQSIIYGTAGHCVIGPSIAIC